MTPYLDALVVILGWSVIASMLALLAVFVGTLAVDALRPPRPVVWRYADAYSPHPHRETVIHVDCEHEADAWRALEAAA